jgi:hypothetical protein
MNRLGDASSGGLTHHQIGTGSDIEPSSQLKNYKPETS